MSIERYVHRSDKKAGDKIGPNSGDLVSIAEEAFETKDFLWRFFTHMRNPTSEASYGKTDLEIWGYDGT